MHLTRSTLWFFAALSSEMVHSDVSEIPAIDLLCLDKTHTVCWIYCTAYNAVNGQGISGAPFTVGCCIEDPDDGIPRCNCCTAVNVGLLNQLGLTGPASDLATNENVCNQILSKVKPIVENVCDICAKVQFLQQLNFVKVCHDK